MNELFNVKDKVVVITGGAGILGKGIAAYLAKEGAKVVVLDRSEEAGKALVDSIKAEGNEAMFLYTDVMDKEVLEGNKVEIMKAYGRIDVLLNAAGGNMASRDLILTQMQQSLRIKLSLIYRLTHLRKWWI